MDKEKDTAQAGIATPKTRMEAALIALYISVKESNDEGVESWNQEPLFEHEIKAIDAALIEPLSADELKASEQDALVIALADMVTAFDPAYHSTETYKLIALNKAREYLRKLP